MAVMPHRRPASTRRTARCDGDTVEYFLRYFGEPTNGQGEFQGGLQRAPVPEQQRQHPQLHPAGARATSPTRLLTSTEPWEQRVDRLFLTVLSRLPSRGGASRSSSRT